MGEQGDSWIKMATDNSLQPETQQNESTPSSEVKTGCQTETERSDAVNSSISSNGGTADDTSRDNYVGNDDRNGSDVHSPSENSDARQGKLASLKSSVVIDLTESEAAPQVYPVADCDSHLDLPEAEDELGLQTAFKEKDAPDLKIHISSEPTNRGEEESEPSMQERQCLPLQETEEGNRQPEVKETSGTYEELETKERKSRLVCRECGKKFTRRETFNLHRHFHTHQDELASLTCKDCGLTFQHRSSLIKHRSEHKQKGVLPGQEKRAAGREGRSQQCEHCAQTFPTLAKLRCHPCQRAPEKPYRCPLCRQDFQYRVSVDAHMRTHSLDNPLRCLECNKGFSCGLMLRIHQRSHAALKPFECPECGMVFRHQSVMENHRRRHRLARLHRCGLCGKCFRYGSLLHQHQFLHTGRKAFRCPECGETFAFSQNMRAHWRQHRKRTHDCPRCPLTFPDLAGLQAHMMDHRREEGTRVGVSTDAKVARSSECLQRTHTCPLCCLTLPDLTNLKAHMLTHEAEEEFSRYGRGSKNSSESQNSVHTCPHCAVTLPDLASLQRHMLSHKPSLNRGLAMLGTVGVNNCGDASVGNWADLLSRKAFRCNECGKTFRHRSVLELHMRIHSKDKPFQCKVCGKSFKFNSYLQQHLIIHTGQKPFKCPDCGKDFAFLQNMKTHQRLHQQKPYRCTQCRKGYSEEGELKRHMMSHTGEKPHKCQLCDKSFGLAYLLRDHLNTHTGERPHRCTECHKSFPWLSSLLVHQKIHARKRQALSQSFSLSLVPQRGRGRGRGTRGRRGGRWVSGWPRWAGSDGVPVLAPQQLYSGHISEGQEWQGRISQPQPSIFHPHLEMHNQWRQQHWQSEAEGKQVLTQQQASGWETAPLATQAVQLSVHHNESRFRQANRIALWGLQTPPVPPKKLTPADKPGGEKKHEEQQQALGWTSLAPPSLARQTAAQYEELDLRCIEGRPAWGFKTPSLVNMSAAVKTGNGQKQQEPTSWLDTSSSTTRSKQSANYEESHSQRAEKTSMCGFQGLPIPPQTLCSADNVESGQKKQKQSLGWVSTPLLTEERSAAVNQQENLPQKGEGTSVWGLQTPSTLPQALSVLNKPVSRPQHQPKVTDHQTPSKMTTSFLCSLLPPSQNSYLTQETVVSEKHANTQALALVKPKEFSQPNGSHPPTTLTFVPNPLLQCMICGQSMPQEVDLHVHYMRHAQGEI